MAVQIVTTAWPPKQGGQYPPEFIGRFYVNPLVAFENVPVGYATDFKIYAPLEPFKLRRTSTSLGPGKPIRVAASPDWRADFWSERLHVFGTDKVLNDLGNVVNDIDTSFEIFNSSRTTAVEINTIGETATDGFTILTGRVPPSPQLIIGIYGSELYTIRAETEEGPPSIAAVFQWIPTTPGFFSVTVSFVGNRITIFTFEPQIAPSNEFEFITAIVESYNGTEQRMSMRENPRQTITYSFFKGGDDAPYTDEPQAMEHVMFDSLGRVFAVPAWEEREVLTAAVSATDTVINVNTLGRDFRVGELLLLWRAWNDTEAQEISGVTDTTVTVATGFVGAFAVADTVVLPTFLGYAQDGPKQEVFKVDAALWSIAFKRINNINYASGASPELPVDFEGLPIWPRPWYVGGQSVRRTWRRNIEEMSSEVGKLVQNFRMTVPRKTHSELRVETFDRTEFEFMRQFLFALRGRQKAFWLPTLTSNFQITATATGGTGTIRVRQNFYKVFVAERSPLNKIQVTLTDGRVFRHTISASAEIGAPPNNETDLTVTPTIGDGFSPQPDYTIANVVRIEYITKHRLNTDNLRFQSKVPRDSMSLTLPIIEVINE